MKSTLSFLVFAFILLSITSVSAQYGGNGYGNGGYGGNGRNSQMGSTMNQSQPEKPKDIPAEVTAAKLVDDMKPALNLDELQAIVINNILIDAIKEQGVLRKQKYSQEDQIKNFNALAETTDQKINQFLSKEQKEKYLIYKEESKSNKKRKEKSKTKEKKEKEN